MKKEFLQNGSYRGGIAGYAINTTFSDCTYTSAPALFDITNVYKGGICAYADYSYFLRCGNQSSIYGGKGVGGIVGRLVGGTISSCYNIGYIRGDITTSGGNTDAGGIVGNMIATNENILKSYIKNCYNRGTIYGLGTRVGGIIGANGKASKGSLTIENCYTIGNLTGNSKVGVLAGFVNEASLNNCYTANPPSGLQWQGGVYINVTKTNCNVVSESQLKECPTGLLNNGFYYDCHVKIG